MDWAKRPPEVSLERERQDAAFWLRHQGPRRRRSGQPLDASSSGLRLRRAFYRTNLTPNQITLLAMLVGVASVPCFLIGTPNAMIAAGVLVWTSAILDGADGILARAKKMYSDVGRALDGTSDTVVVLSLSAAAYHFWVSNHDVLGMLLFALAALVGFVQAWLYDFYKESYLQMTDPNWNGHPERGDEVAKWVEELKAKGEP